ncbi:hypothetical protein QBC45DRAFT_444364 [Copromyces sp. CBS 386.78]|nr:hypothetical protein QBC45DRAFT_444364 [Copromyces sp. CBS 386.78]
MAGTKRSAPSRSSSPEDGPNKRARIGHNDETKNRGAQDKNFEREQEEELKDSKKYHEQATNDQEMVVNDDSSVNDEAKKDDETRSQPAAVIDQFQHGVTNTSPTVSRKGNDENLPPSYMKLEEPGEKDEKQRLEDEVVDGCLGRYAESSDVMPATKTNKDEEQNAQQDQRPDKVEVAQAGPVHGQAPATIATMPLSLRPSPSPVTDQRISQWKNEKRTFKGTITRERDAMDAAGAAEAARAAQKSPLMVDGEPQFVLFCDGSSVYKPGSRELRGSQDGGYAVVFRDPYDTDKSATARACESAKVTLSHKEDEDGIKIEDFTIRNWLSHRTFGAGHCEIAALAQALEEVAKRIDQHHPHASMVKIFTDSDGSLGRLQKGILTFGTTTTDGSNTRKRKHSLESMPLPDRDTSFYAKITNPFVQVIVWLSHYLSDRGCQIEMIWMPRNTTLGHKLADHMAYKWRKNNPGDAFNQKYLPRSQRDGIMDKLHDEVGPIERERVYIRRPASRRKIMKKVKRGTQTRGKEKRSERDLIAVLDSPSDYIALDSEEEELEPQPQRPSKRRRKREGDATRANMKQRSTTDFIACVPDSDSSEDKKPADEPEPKPKPKPQARKSRKNMKIRGAIQIPAKGKEAPILMQQHVPAAAGAGGFLNGNDHDFKFTFDQGTCNMPAYPTPSQQHGNRDPGPGCPLCHMQHAQGDDEHEYPWSRRSGYTGLPSQWTLRG